GVDLRDFFFASRRRHTRFSRDWSSDVCSSDLLAYKLDINEFRGQESVQLLVSHLTTRRGWVPDPTPAGRHKAGPTRKEWSAPHQIGRASCRERVETGARGAADRPETAPERPRQ